jgi:hypothetical protein
MTNHRSSAGGWFDHSVLAELLARRWTERRPYFSAMVGRAHETWLRAARAPLGGDAHGRPIEQTIRGDAE